MRSIARRLGRAHASIRTFMVDNAGRRPRPPGSPDLRLSLAEREEISRGLAAGLSLRATAACGPAAPCAAPRRGPRAGYATKHRPPAC